MFSTTQSIGPDTVSTQCKAFGKDRESALLGHSLSFTLVPNPLPCFLKSGGDPV